MYGVVVFDVEEEDGDRRSKGGRRDGRATW